MKYTYIELFSGPGGLATGFRRAGFLPLISVEASDTTVGTYCKNYNVQVLSIDTLVENIGQMENILDQSYEGILIHGDARLVTNTMILEILKKRFCTTTVDLVVGCPPCESFSMAGKRLEKDERNDLFKEIIRVAQTVDAKLIFFENVKGLLTKKRSGVSGGQFEFVSNAFEERNPTTGVQFRLASKRREDILLIATKYGVPQKRERIFLVGINVKFENASFNYPVKTHTENKLGYISVKEALCDLPEIHSGEGAEEINIEYSYDDYFSDRHKDFLNQVAHINKTSRLTSHKAIKHMDYMVVRFHHIKQGEGMKAACDRLITENKEYIVKQYFPKKLFAARGRRLIADSPAFTVTSHCFDEMLHPYYDRALTVREAARLQTFPDNYIFDGPYTVFHSSPIQDRYEQIGDAVPVILAEKLALELKNTLEQIREF